MTPSPISCWARSGSSRIFTRAVTRCLGPAERLRGAVLGQAAVEHRADRLGLLVGVELLARDVLDRAVGVLGLDVADDDRHVGQAERAGGGDAVKAGDELEAVSPSSRTTSGTSMPCSSIEPASALTCASSSARTFSGTRISVERDAGARPRGWWWPSWSSCGSGPPRWRADPPPPARPPGRATLGWRVGPLSGRRRSGLKPVAIATEMQGRSSSRVLPSGRPPDHGSRRRTTSAPRSVAPASDRAHDAPRSDEKVLEAQDLGDGVGLGSEGLIKAAEVIDGGWVRAGMGACWSSWWSVLLRSGSQSLGGAHHRVGGEHRATWT